MTPSKARWAGSRAADKFFKRERQMLLAGAAEAGTPQKEFFWAQWGSLPFEEKKRYYGGDEREQEHTRDNRELFRDRKWPLQVGGPADGAGGAGSLAC